MKTLYPLHSFIRRNLALVERFIAALGLSALVYGVILAIPVYPLHWDVVVAGAVFFLTLASPVAGYFVAVSAAAYPLFNVSLYLAVLFLAVAVIGQHIFIQNLSGTLLTLASPLLGSVYLAWMIPLLGGLWWGPLGGALMGAFAALFGMIVAGMAGLSPDWMNLYGVLPVLVSLPEKFAQANSLESIALVFLPIMPDSTSLLYYLLQMGSWALVGWLAGMMNEKEWAQYQSPRAGMLIALIGSAMLAVLQIMLSSWLRMPVYENSEWALGLTTLFSALAVILLEFGQDFLEHPLPIPSSARLPRVEISPAPTVESTPAVSPAEPAKPQPSRKSDEADDLIMLELD